MIGLSSRAAILQGIVAVIIFVISYVFYQGDWNTDRDPLIFISVISARENTEHRRAIRNTWGRRTEQSIFDMKFVVGRGCYVPLEDRAADGSCAEISWRYGHNYDQLFWSNSFTTSTSQSQKSLKGFAFLVNHPITLQSIKLANWGQGQNKTTVKFINAHNHEQLDSLEFQRFAHKESELNTQTYLLPRGFEGIIYADHDLEMEPKSSSCNLWTDHGRLVEFTWLIGNDGVTLPIGTTGVCVPVAVSFVFTGIKKFVDERPLRLQKWNEQLVKTSLDLAKENEKYNDILFVETVDVYRNLTSKMLDVFKWVADNRRKSFLLKADDDVFVDLEKIGSFVVNVADEVRREIWWWADLKERWAVSRFGKWRDDVHLYPVYPPFPCGGAYVLSPRLAGIIGQNSSSLTKYPFEDTALGLWIHTANLSPILGQSKECVLSCRARHSDCDLGSCFVLLNKPEDMYELMTSYHVKGFVWC